MCDVKRCRQPGTELSYYGHDVCCRCWSRHCNGLMDLKELLGVGDDGKVD